MPISTSEPCFVRASASRSRDWPPGLVPIRNDSNDLFERVLGSPQRPRTSCGRSFLMRYTDLMQRLSSTAWGFQNRASTASVSAPSGVEPQHPSTTARSPSTVRSRGQVLIATPISTWPLGSRLYLPKSELVRMNQSTTAIKNGNSTPSESLTLLFRPRLVTSPSTTIAADLIEQAVDTDIEHACVLGGANFGRRSSFPERLRELDEPYVLALEAVD